MGIHIKRKTAVALGRETTYKTESDQMVNMGVQDISVDVQKVTITDEQAYGRIEGIRGSRKATEMAQVVLTGIVDVAQFGQFLMAALGSGAVVVDSPESGANTHSFAVLNNNQHPPYSVFFKNDNRDEVCLGCRLATLQFNIVAGDWVTYTATFMGDAPTAASETPTYVDVVQFSADQAMLRLAAVGGSFAGATIPLSTMDFVIDKGLEAHYAFGSTAPSNMINKTFGVTGNMALLYEDNVYYDIFRAHDLKAMEIVLTGENVAGTSTPSKMTFTIPQLHIATWDDNGGLDDKVEQKMSFTAEYESATANAMITADIVNAEAGSVY